MQWTSLLSAERVCDPKYVEGQNRSIFVQDHDRIIFSAPFRRLANKTQVHPLYDHDHIHHRLIHSVEVSSVGRSLAMRIGHWLIEQGEIAEGDDHLLANIVQAACAAHDIGNPPFGHSGEAAIGDWFREKFSEGAGLFADAGQGLQAELTAFEGNAQGFRILTRLEMYRNEGGMRLSKAVLGAFMKYPVTAGTRVALPEKTPPYAGLKKFGLFQSEAAIFADAAHSLGLPEENSDAGRWWRRHPLVFLVEAADDICYNIVDLEDAFTSGGLPFDVVRDRLNTLANQTNRDTAGMTQAEQIALLRALAIGSAISVCVEAFKENYAAIMDGTFSEALIDASARAEAFRAIKALARDRIFTSARKTELEILGRKVIRNVMDEVLPVYEAMAAQGWQAEALPDHAAQIARALSLDLRDIDAPDKALHGLADFVSGMTDRYALRMSRLFSAA